MPATQPSVLSLILIAPNTHWETGLFYRLSRWHHGMAGKRIMAVSGRPRTKPSTDGTRGKGRQGTQKNGHMTPTACAFCVRISMCTHGAAIRLSGRRLDDAWGYRRKGVRVSLEDFNMEAGYLPRRHRTTWYETGREFCRIASQLRCCTQLASLLTPIRLAPSTHVLRFVSPSSARAGETTWASRKQRADRAKSKKYGTRVRAERAHGVCMVRVGRPNRSAADTSPSHQP
jgi:hypothetical protein